MPAVGGLLRFLRRRSLVAGEDSDGALLARFAAGDEPAFTVLLYRHAPLVWSACRRMLPNSSDAEDAFQAVFFVLARKGASLSRDAPLAPWLHRVAWRTATKLRIAGQRRLRRETAVVVPQCHPPPELAADELRAVLDEEINRLPEIYRQPILLCCLDGLTNEEAAQRLGCPKGTILSRLSRGRERLREALRRRGMDVPAVLPLEGLTLREVPAALTDAILSGGPPSASVSCLTKGVLSAMFFERFRYVIATAMVLILGGFGAAWMGSSSARDPAAKKVAPQPQAGSPPKADKQEADKVPAKQQTPRNAAAFREALDRETYLEVVNDTATLCDILDLLSDTHKVTFTIDYRAFDSAKIDVEKVQIARRPIRRTNAKLGDVLRVVLDRVPSQTRAVYLIQNDGIQITTEEAVRRRLGIRPEEDDNGPAEDEEPALPPLVWEEFSKVALSRVLEKLADVSGSTVILDARAEKMGTTPITAKIMNVPIDSALRLVADMGGLGVVRLDGAYYVTTPENAERLQKQWKKRLGMPPRGERFQPPGGGMAE